MKSDSHPGMIFYKRPLSARGSTTLLGIFYFSSCSVLMELKYQVNSCSECFQYRSSADQQTLSLQPALVISSLCFRIPAFPACPGVKILATYEQVKRLNRRFLQQRILQVVGKRDVLKSNKASILPAIGCGHWNSWLLTPNISWIFTIGIIRRPVIDSLETIDTNGIVFTEIERTVQSKIAVVSALDSIDKDV